MEKIYSVRIIRRNDQVIQGIYLKEFWKLCGVYVREEVVDGDEWQKDNLAQKVDCNIFCREAAHEFQDSENEFAFDVDCFRNNSELTNKEKCQQLDEKLRILLKQIGEKLAWDEDLKQQFNKISKVFIDNDFAYNEYMGHLFVPQMGEKRKKLIKVYTKCLNDFLDEGILEEGQYLRFAYLNCARKYERACEKDGKIGVFDKRDLMEKAHALMEKDPAFTSADMLAGLIGLSARSLWLDGKVYLINAIQKEMEKKQKYCAFMYYALGHFYEWQEEDLKKAWGEYEKIQEIDTGNYRALYKIAYRKFKKNDRVEAIKQFNEIYEMMKGREKKDWITPIETEYYYKCARFLEYLNADEKPTKVELRRIRERVFENSKCVQNFFEAEDIESCKPMLLENMENRGKYCR